MFILMPLKHRGGDENEKHRGGEVQRETERKDDSR